MDRDYSAIQRVLVVTLLCNLLATAIKLTVGVWTGALSLVADGLDTFFDSLSNIVGLVGVRLSSRPPDADHPYGHRKFETLAALFIAAALFVAAWELGVSAVERLLSPSSPTVNRWTILAIVVGAAIQGAAGWWELRKAGRLHSEVLLADARHTLATLGISAAVLVGLGLTWLGYIWADPLVALLVAGIIAKIGFDTVVQTVPPLVDRAPLEEAQVGAVVAAVEGVESYHRIRSRGPADSVAVDLHIRVDSTLSIQEGNAIADEVRRRLLAMPGVADVTVHAEAQRSRDSSADLHSAAKLAAQELDVYIHECWVQEVDGVLSVHLHVGVNPNLTLTEAHDLVDRLEKTLQVRQRTIDSVHSHIELANREILPGARVSSGLQERVANVIAGAIEQIPQLDNPHDIRVRQIEGRLFISVEAWVDGDLSVSDAHELSTQLQETVRKGIPNAGEVLVHLEPHQSEAEPDLESSRVS